jgi:replicative DNA helicase
MSSEHQGRYMQDTKVKQELTCIYVPAENEDGKWGVSEHFKKLDASYDGFGWSIPIKFRNEVEEICKKANLLCVEQQLEFDSFEALKSNNILNYYKSQATKIEQQIGELTIKLGIEVADINDIQNNTNDKHLIELVNQYSTWQKKIKFAENKERIASISLPQANNTTLAHLLENNSEKKLIDELKNVSPGVATGYTIGDIDLKFPGGVVSIIAAPTSHGKTSALINFALGAIQNNPKTNVYFFTYEESSASILSLFINTYIGQKLSKNNRESITSYFRDNSTQYILDSMRNNFVSFKQMFFDELINTGRLRILYSEMTALELIEAIRFIKKNTDTGLICIDYMQLLKLSRNTTSSRQEELKQICLLLKDCAVETGLPIVLTAQFNRTVVAEADLSPVNIGEAGDIERIASLIIGMYNRNFVLSREGNKSKDGSTIEQEAAIYFEVLKGRGIGNGHNTVMDFDGNTGKLTNRSKVISDFENMSKKQTITPATKAKNENAERINFLNALANS